MNDRNKDTTFGESIPAICPRCGGPIGNDEVLNPLSRHRFLHICGSCGYDEAIRDMRGDPLPFAGWHDVKSRLANGENVYEVTCCRTATFLVVAASEETAMEADVPDEYMRYETDWASTDCIELDRDGRPS